MAKYYTLRMFFITFITFFIHSCATVTHGSHTGFVVETVPSGALVITDRIYPNAKQKSKDGQPGYYGCKSTPCTIQMPRKSDFNVLIIKEGYQPSTHIVTKEHGQLLAKVKKNNAELGNNAVGIAVGAANVIYLETTAAEVGTSIFASTAGVAAASGVFAVAAVNIYGASSGVDLATGAATDITPNPLNVELIPETSPEETTALVEAFFRTRNVNAKNAAPRTK